MLRRRAWKRSPFLTRRPTGLIDNTSPPLRYSTTNTIIIKQKTYSTVALLSNCVLMLLSKMHSAAFLSNSYVHGLLGIDITRASGA